MATEWISRITAAGVLMVLPALLCDRYLHDPRITFVAVVGGFAVGMTYLLMVTGVIRLGTARKTNDHAGEDRKA